MKSTIRLAAGSLALLALAGTAAPEEVTVFAAASLTDALGELGRQWEKASGNKLVFNFGSSSDLARQIKAGARADLFFSADRAQMDGVEEAGLLRPPDRVNVLSNTLVIVVPSGSTLKLGGPADLKGVRRIALADPEGVPAGVYARRYLEKEGLWEALRDKVTPTLDVRAALAAVAGEHVEVGIVYRTDAALSKQVRVAFEVPRERGPDIVYPLGLLAPARPAAAGLRDFLLSDQAWRVFAKYGFGVIGWK